MSHSAKTTAAVVYARVSSKDQEREGFSIPAQLHLLRCYAHDSAVSVLEEFVDVETAKQTGRTGFGKMVALLRKTQPRPIVMVEKTDRLYRNLKDWITIDELGVEVHFVKENVVLSPEARSSEKFIHGIKVLMAKNYIDNLSEEVRKGMLAKARLGIWPSFAPLGYLNVTGPDGKRTIAPDPDLAPIVRAMFERYATGKYSLKQIAKIARADGLAYRKSRTFVPTSTVHKILCNRIYSGTFDFNGVTYVGVYEPIISVELWEQVSNVLNGRGKSKIRTRRFAFSGLIKCGHCGCSLVGDIKKGRYIYYRCTGYKGRCPEPYTREELLEAEFNRLIERTAFSDDQLDWVSRVLSARSEQHARDRQTDAARLTKQHAIIESRIEAMYVDKLDGRIDAEFYARKLEEWRAAQADIRTRLVQEHGPASASLSDLRRIAMCAGELFRQQPAIEKRSLLDCVLRGCTWAGGKLTPEWRLPFSPLAPTHS